MVGGPDLWDRATVARMSGLDADTITTYASRSRAKLRRGEALSPSDLPVPLKIGRRSYWLPADVRQWLAVKAPYRRTSDVFDVVPGDQLREHDVVDDGSGTWWYVQMRRGPDERGDVYVRVGRSGAARTGVWRRIRAGGKVKRLRRGK